MELYNFNWEPLPSGLTNEALAWRTFINREAKDEDSLLYYYRLAHKPYDRFDRI